MIEGVKSGVDIFQAKEALLKLESRHRLQLQMHLSLAERCQKLAPKALRGAGVIEILEDRDTSCGGAFGAWKWRPG